MQKQSIAFFDFDGTISRSDSLLLFLKFYYPTFLLFLKSLLFSPILIAQKVGLINNSKAKENLTKLFFKGENSVVFNQKCDSFAKKELDKIVMPSAKKAIQNHLKNGVKVVVVSASFENYLIPYFEPMGVEVLATKLRVRHNKIDGSFDGKNCYGNEKVSRIKERFNLTDYQEIFAYGDTKGDKPMLSLATKAFYKHFS